MAAHRKWKPLIQFEDFGGSNAFRLLANYQDKICTFNDDIQGTASVVLAGLIGPLLPLKPHPVIHSLETESDIYLMWDNSFNNLLFVPGAVELSGIALANHKFLFLGAGEAGTGIGQMIVAALVAEGMPAEEARKRCWYVDSRGLVTASRKKSLEHHKLEFAHEHDAIPTFEEAVYTLKPSAIIGVSGQPRTFTKEIVKFLAKSNRTPIIFALSNPTSQSECTAAEVRTPFITLPSSSCPKSPYLGL